MNRLPVTSTDIQSIGYEEVSMTLEIQFHTGGTYQYLGVGPVVHTDFMNASSKGKFFHKNIKNNYQCIKV